jgi:hypothetical protein
MNEKEYKALVAKAQESHYSSSWELIEDSDSYGDFIDGIRRALCESKKGQELLDDLFTDFQDVLKLG